MNRRDLLTSATLIPAAALAATAQQQQAQPAAPPKEELPPPARGVKITVIKRAVNSEFQKYWDDEKDIPICSSFKDGQEFFVDFPWAPAPPKGFCGWAWDDIVKTVYSVHGGKIRRGVACCSDGMRPVYFLLERVV